MDSSIKACIINAHTGNNWYPAGQKRLVDSLYYHGKTVPVLRWGKFPLEGYNERCPYNIKAAAFEKAIELGYEVILWLDCSVWTVKDPMPIFDRIMDDGYYFWKSGYSVVQTASDRCLNYFGVKAEDTTEWPECASGVLGVNIKNPNGHQFILKFIQAAKDGIFEGTRDKSNLGSHPSFIHYRQDQSCASVILNQMGLKVDEPNNLCSYYHPSNMAESVIFSIRGM